MKEYIIIETYHNNKFENASISDRNLEDTIKDLQALKKIMPWNSMAMTTYHVGSGTKYRIENLFTVI